MSEHYTKNTLSAAKHCNKCGRATQHRVWNGRIAHCLECVPKRDSVNTAAEDAQRSLFTTKGKTHEQ